MYCARCRLVVDDDKKCPQCGSRMLRDPQPEYLCYVTETDPMFGGMLKDVLEKNGIPALSSSTMGAGMAMRVGPMFDRIRFYVPYEYLPAAAELVRELFDAPDCADPEPEEPEEPEEQA